MASSVVPAFLSSAIKRVWWIRPVIRDTEHWRISVIAFSFMWSGADRIYSSADNGGGVGPFYVSLQQVSPQMYIPNTPSQISALPLDLVI